MGRKIIMIVFLLLVFAVLILVNRDEINDELKRNEE
jgi:hypothetical protein